MTILNCGGNVSGSGLPDPTSASAGDVLTLDSNKDAVWQTPSGGGSGTVTTTMNKSMFLTWYTNANYGDRLDGVITLRDKNSAYLYSIAGSFVCTPLTRPEGGTQVGTKQFSGTALMYKANINDDYSYERYVPLSFTMNQAMNRFLIDVLYKSTSYSQIIPSTLQVEYSSTAIDGLSFDGRAVHYT